MKKLIALILCVSMLTGMLPAASLADTLLYEYPQVNAYLSSNDREALEYEFRQWAAEAIKAYCAQLMTLEQIRNSFPGKDNRTKEPIEYGRLAQTKHSFDLSDRGKIDENIYNLETITDAEQNGIYLWVILESLQESMYADAEKILQKYQSLSSSEKKNWMFNVTSGNLELDEYSQIIGNETFAFTVTNIWKAMNDLSLSLTHFAGAFVSVVYGETYAEDWESLVKLIVECARTTVENMKTTIQDDISIYTQNTIRQALVDDLASVVLYTSDQMIGSLRESYVNANNDQIRNHEYGPDNYLDIIEGLINLYDNEKDAFESKAQEKTNEEVSKEIDDLLKETGNDIIDFIPWDVVIGYIMLDVARTAYTELIDYGIDKITKLIPEDYKDYRFSLLGSRIQPTDLITALKEAFKDSIDEETDSLIEDWKTRSINGEKLTLVQMVDETVIEIANCSYTLKFAETFFEKLAINLTGVAVAGGVLGELFTSEEKEAIGEGVYDLLESLIQKTTSGYIEDEVEGKEHSANKTIGDAMKLFFKFIAKKCKEEKKQITSQLEKPEKAMTALKEMLAGGEKDQGNLSKELEALERKAENMKTVGWVFTIVSDTFGSFWNTGISIGDAVVSTFSTMSGEGIMSMLGMRMIASYRMRLAQSAKVFQKATSTDLINAFMYPTNNVDTGYIERVALDPDSISVEDLKSVVDLMYTLNKYDIAGSSAYYNLVLHTDVFYKIKGDTFNRLTSAQFAKYIADTHINIHSKKGLLSYDEAAEEYNYYIGLQELYTMNDEWQVLFQ